MKPIDKFGREIYPYIFKIMLGYGRILENNDYLESIKKPNLFYRKDNFYNVIYFADMRGTDIVPIWDDPSPLFYVNFPEFMPMWKRRRLSTEELNKLRICRLSFYDVCEPDGLMFGEIEDGFCKVCGKDFENNGLFCSSHCEEVDKELGKTNCYVCGKQLRFKDVIYHHLSYENNKTISVCRSCHGKIHRSNTLNRLKPIDKLNQKSL